MTNESLTLKLDALENRAKKMVEAFHYLKRELQEAINENEVLRKQIENKNEELENFQNQSKITKIANYVAEDKKLANEYKLKINEYLKEIDKGLAYLQKV
ncbi:MAG: hypothetical protein EAZ27_08515 [Cytophagales bacterium]|nr:MAG: hypothetical protein EAZ27_08515 [Cytophagales bacterium]